MEVTGNVATRCSTLRFPARAPHWECWSNVVQETPEKTMDPASQAPIEMRLKESIIEVQPSSQYPLVASGEGPGEV